MLIAVVRSVVLKVRFTKLAAMSSEQGQLIPNTILAKLLVFQQQMNSQSLYAATRQHHQ